MHTSRLTRAPGDPVLVQKTFAHNTCVAGLLRISF